MKLKRKVWIVLGFSLAAVFAALALLVVDLYKTSPKTLLKVMADNVDLQVKDVIYTDVGHSGEKWEIRADSARYHKKENVALFDKVKVKLVTPDGKIYRMTGERGSIQTDTKNIEITGNVQIFSDRGERLYTDVLHYNHAKSAIHTDGAVIMQGEQVLIKGIGMTLNLKQGDLAIQSMVRGEIRGK